MQNFRSSTAGFNGESECWLFTVKCNGVVDVWALFITSYSKGRLSKATFEGLGGFCKTFGVFLRACKCENGFIAVSAK